MINKKRKEEKREELKNKCLTALAEFVKVEGRWVIIKWVAVPCNLKAAMDWQTHVKVQLQLPVLIIYILMIEGRKKITSQLQSRHRSKITIMM